jgi:CO/xanthine dehydrogenase FAD-binding subunit
MKAAPFEYALAESIDEVATLLEAGDGEAIVIAGGQSLMPMLAMRMARPEMIIDINGIAELSGIEVSETEVTIKACSRQAMVLASDVIAKHVPMLTKAISNVGHTQTRNRGTIGGSLSHADPSSEIPLTALAMEAEVSLHSVNGTRRVAINDFFEGPMMTACEPNELLVALHFTLPGEGNKFGVGFQEVSPRHGDFAIVSAAARIHLDEHGSCTKAVVALGGVDGTPIRIPALEKRLENTKIDGDTLKAALQEIPASIDPGDDQHATAKYRHRVALVLAERVILEAIADAENVE